MPVREIRSRQHPLLKQLRRALVRGERLPNGLLPVETLHLLVEALEAGIPVDTVLFDSEREKKTVAVLREHGSTAACYRAPVNGVSTTEAPQGILALVRPPEWRAHHLFQPSPALVILLAGIQDPGNAGTILRTAEAFSATGALLLRGSVHPENPKLVRAAAGSTFRLPHLAGIQLDQALAMIAAQRAALYALQPRASLTIEQVDLTRPSVLAVGAEGSGLPPDLLAHAKPVSIPRTMRVESLNAAVAAALALSEAARQRGLRGSV